MSKFIQALLLIAATLFSLPLQARADAQLSSGLSLTGAPSVAVPAPKEVLGFSPGDDRRLASWGQVVDYFRRLAAASPRVRFETLGKTTMGAPFVMATISAPENLTRLEEYKRIQSRLADPRTLGKSPESEAARLISRGKTIVLITCGIHSTEVGSYLSSMLIAHRLASSDDPLVRQILRETIILLVPSLNPDGVDIVKNWYDKTLGTPFEGTSPPELYHKYTGHDNNRDWYAFTQVETQLTVDKIHNVWRPQIVHDIHQQGAFGSRLFLPPYMAPVEPNVPKQIIEGYTELGLSMKDELRSAGFPGITWDSTYDAWTPARAYSHYHGGVRILSETASARIATPITVKAEDLRGGLGYDSRKASENFPDPWTGGQWRLRDITSYMTTAAFSLLNHAARNRERWLRRFYEIGLEAVRPRREGEVRGYVIRRNLDGDHSAADNLAGILQRGGVEILQSRGLNTRSGLSISRDDYLVMRAQPYGAFAKALLEQQQYPNLLDGNGQPQPPYDVTAHTLPLLMGVTVTPIKEDLPAGVRLTKARIPLRVNVVSFSPGQEGARRSLRLGLYKSHVPSMDEGWTRYVLEGQGFRYRSLEDRDILHGNLRSSFNVIIIPDHAPSAILNGHAAGSMPEGFTGGLGPNGVKALREFVEAGGTLICLNRASNFAIEQFKLPVRDITRGARRTEVYIPGSILRTEMDTTHPISTGKGGKDSIAWVEHSPVFALADDGAAAERERVRVVARYPSQGELLLSGWLLGGERLRGRAALMDVTLGKGRVFLFGFRPQYRAQSTTTYPLFFGAILAGAAG